MEIRKSTGKFPNWKFNGRDRKPQIESAHEKPGAWPGQEVIWMRSLKSGTARMVTCGASMPMGASKASRKAAWW